MSTSARIRNAACLLAWLQSSVAVAQSADTTLPNGYSTAPLREPLALSAQQVEDEARKFLTWAEANGPRLTREQMTGPREHAYYLIGERVKQIYAEGKTILPSRSDRVLQMLFVNADNLGVYGGSQIFGALKDPAIPGMPVRTNPPRGLTVALDGDLLRVRSELGWTLAVPYYFMIWSAGDQQRSSGRVQMLTVSTGTAADKGALGHSQATLMLLFSPDTAAALPTEIVRSQLGLPEDTPAMPLGVRNLASQRAFNETTKLHSEATSWSDESGAYLVTYSGIDGTYQANRPHFVDFVRSITTAR